MKPNHGKIQSLNQQDCDQLLQRNSFGHLACHTIEDIYIVPISYAFDEGYLYSHSRPGKKIEMMRKNSSICIQVEEVQNFFSWKSVIAWGEFEELQGDVATTGMRRLIQQFLASENDKRRSELEVDFTAQLEAAIIFRMKVQRLTGRFEGLY